MTRTTKADINNAFAVLEAEMMQSGWFKGQTETLVIDHAACYGGYTLVLINNENGGQSFPTGGMFNADRVSGAEFVSRMQFAVSVLRMVREGK